MTHEDIEATKAPLLEHLVELRNRLVRSVIAFLICFILCFALSRASLRLERRAALR